MQSEATVPSKKSSSSSDSSVRENQTRRPDRLLTSDNKDTVTTLLEASSAKLKRTDRYPDFLVIPPAFMRMGI